LLTGSALLLVEDNPGDARLLREMFAEDGPSELHLTQVGSMREAEKLLRERVIDIILLDLGLPDTEGLGAVQRAHAAAPRIPLVVLTGLDDESMALLALKEGAQDYLVKGRIEARGLLRALRYAVERKTMEEALFVEKERAQVTLNCIGDAVICTDSSGVVTFLNVVAEQLTGWLRRDAEGEAVSDVFQLSDAGTDHAALLPITDQTELRANVQMPSSCVLVRRDGTRFPIEGSVAPIHDRVGCPTGAVVVFRDVSAARAASREIIYSAQHDFLTGLPNRLLLNDRISQAIVLARRHSTQTAMLFLDLDGFKHINDSLGHSVGDRLLQSIAGRLVDCARASDTVSRQGGDEFIVLLADMQQPEDAAIAARRILNAISAAHSIDHHDLHVTASIGVSVYPDDGKDAETLIKNADNAMYRAKADGRNTYHMSTKELSRSVAERMSLESGLHLAMERDEFELFYQPQVDTRTMKITGMEALLRWRHPERGVITPTEFINVAEDRGYIVVIGDWVLRTACAQAAMLRERGHENVRVSVNLSARQFREISLASRIEAAISEARLDPHMLELEITESVAVENVELTLAILTQLRALGITIAIDDFGTGHSALNYLKRFPIDTLKIDRSFVADLPATDDAAIVRSVIQLAHGLNLRVIAEGVERKDQLDFLRDNGCPEVQGFYFGNPIRAADVEQLWTRMVAV
jgi:diguanylate cyclase (GGDEF)-like protein/PAS domain S-box-containing protein